MQLITEKCKFHQIKSHTHKKEEYFIKSLQKKHVVSKNCIKTISPKNYEKNANFVKELWENTIFVIESDIEFLSRKKVSSTKRSQKNNKFCKKLHEKTVIARSKFLCSSN